MDADQLRRYLEFYQDLGFQTLYHRASQSPLPQIVEVPEVVTVPVPLPSLAPSDDSLFRILEDIGDCRRCRLHEGRSKIVFGVGNEKAPLVFVGEGPGADEDEQGIPFVGRAGQLLTQMIEGTARKEGITIGRDDVYICNVVKCRPPGNRTPEPDEMEICGEFLYRQLSAIHRLSTTSGSVGKGSGRSSVKCFIANNVRAFSGLCSGNRPAHLQGTRDAIRKGPHFSKGPGTTCHDARRCDAG